MIYKCGNNLAVTKFILQRETAGTWITATKYEHNQKYRFHVCFQNMSPNTIPSGVYIAHILVQYKLSGALFGSQMNWGGDFLMIGTVDGHSDFNNVIAPGRMRWFDFGMFTWLGPQAQLSMFPVEFSASYMEIAYTRNAPWARLLVNQG